MIVFFTFFIFLAALFGDDHMQCFHTDHKNSFFLELTGAQYKKAYRVKAVFNASKDVRKRF